MYFEKSTFKIRIFENSQNCECKPKAHASVELKTRLTKLLRSMFDQYERRKHYLVLDCELGLLDDLREPDKKVELNEPSKKILEISKRIYQLKRLEVTINKLMENKSNFLPNPFNAFKYLVYEGLNKFSPQEILPVVSYCKKDSKFDYQCADAIRVAKMLNNQGCKITAQQLANKVISQFQKNKYFEKAEITGPGFINIRLKDNYIKEMVIKILRQDVNPPYIKSRKVIVDFSSPNIAKEMHVGHLRSTVIGDCICRILEYVGFDVVRTNHVGDWGTQFGMLTAHMKDELISGQKPQNISDLQKLYKESKKRFDEDEEFQTRARKNVVALQSGADPAVYNTWKEICEITRKEFQKIYKRLKIDLMEKGESFYQSRMETLVDELARSGRLTEDNGCKVMHFAGSQTPLMVVKSDGGYTYDTSDLATAQYRLVEEQADWCLYVVDLGQRVHLDLIFKAAEELGWYNPAVQRVEHIGFGVVLGEGKKKFKSRSGDTVKLVDLLNESVSRAKNKLLERSSSSTLDEKEVDKIAEALGYNCIKYADLSHNLVADYEFSYDRMLDDRGNTAVYLMYTYSRIKSIIRKSEVDIDTIVRHLLDEGVQMENIYEIRLLKKVVMFPEVIFRIVFETYPHYLCEYLYDLCVIINEYYDNCKIIDLSTLEANIHRLAHVFAASLVLKKGANLLGLELLEKM